MWRESVWEHKNPYCVWYYYISWDTEWLSETLPTHPPKCSLRWPTFYHCILYWVWHAQNGLPVWDYILICRFFKSYFILFQLKRKKKLLAICPFFIWVKDLLKVKINYLNLKTWWSCKQFNFTLKNFLKEKAWIFRT